MHPPYVREAALKLIAEGRNDCEVSRILGLPRTTIRDWRKPTYRRRTLIEHCPRCWQPARPIRFTSDDYAELLGLYLGDGHISEYPRTQRLRIALDRKYPRITCDARALLQRCFPRNSIDVVTAPGCVHVSVYSSHLRCLFPQHGAGPKYERRILLESWQTALLGDSPWPFLRGCIRSDGCAFMNRTGPYEYLSYDFTNSSTDVVNLFAAACELVGVEYCRTRWSKRKVWKVRINRRDSVALMLEHVGIKA
jgi:hypothetical protein